MQPKAPGTTTIMLVEDDHGVAQTLTDALESSGYRVWLAETGADAKTLLEQTRPDLIILDLMLPDVDGLVLCSGLKAIADVPIVICSATPQKRDAILGHTDRFKCLVSHDGMFNAESAWGTTEELWFNKWEFKGTPYDNRAGYEKWSPHQYAKNFKTPTLVVHGQRDYRLDVSEGFQLFTTLQMGGVPSKMLYFPDEGHWVLKPQNSRLWYKTVNDWVDQWTKK